MYNPNEPLASYCEDFAEDMDSALEEMSGNYYVCPLDSLEVLCTGNFDKCFEFQVWYEGDTAMYNEADFLKRWGAQTFVLTLGGPGLTGVIAKGSLDEMGTLLVETMLGYAEWYVCGKNVSDEYVRFAREGNMDIISQKAFTRHWGS